MSDEDSDAEKKVFIEQIIWNSIRTDYRWLGHFVDKSQ